MDNQAASTEIVQTMTRQAFDPETVSITVGAHPNDPRTIWVRIRDEVKKITHEFNVIETHTIADVASFIHAAGVALGLETDQDPALVDKAVTLQNQAAANSAAGLTLADTDPTRIGLANTNSVGVGAVGNSPAAIFPGDTAAGQGVLASQPAALTSLATGLDTVTGALAEDANGVDENGNPVALKAGDEVIVSKSDFTDENGNPTPEPAPAGGELAPATGGVSAGSAPVGGDFGNQK